MLKPRISASLGVAIAVLVMLSATLSPNLFAQNAKKPSTLSDTERQELVEGLAKLQREVASAEQAVAGKPKLSALLPDVQVCVKALDWGLNYDKVMEPKMLVTAREVLRVGLRSFARPQASRNMVSLVKAV